MKPSRELPVRGMLAISVVMALLCGSVMMMTQTLSWTAIGYAALITLIPAIHIAAFSLFPRTVFILPGLLVIAFLIDLSYERAGRYDAHGMAVGVHAVIRPWTEIVYSAYLVLIVSIGLFGIVRAAVARLRSSPNITRLT